MSKKKQRQNKATTAPIKKYAGTFYNGYGNVIEEPFAGAWQSNISLKPDNALQNYALFSCVTMIANDIGLMEPELRRESDTGPWVLDKSRVYKKIRKLLEYPNSYQTSQQFLSEWSYNLSKNGNFYYFIEWDYATDTPLALYGLDAGRVTPLRSPDGEIFYKCYSDNVIGLKTETVFTSKEIGHDRINCLFDPLIGIPPLWAAAIHAFSSLEQGKTSYEFYKNAARPSALLIAPQDISPEDAKTLKADYEAAMSGRAHAGKMMVLSGGLQYQQLTMSAEDQKLIELLKFNAEAICACFHIPPHMILGTAPTYNNIEALRQDYYQRALQSIITGIENSLHKSLGLHDVDDELWIKLNTNPLLRMDKATRYKVHGQAIKDGFMTRNEARLEEDWEPVEGGDLILVQAQDTTIQAIEVRDERFISMETPQQVIPTQIPLDKPSDKVDNEEVDGEEVDDELAQKFLIMLTERLS